MGQTSRVTGRATNVKREADGTLVVRYHSTDVVTVKPDGSIVLDTGGWRTLTTRTRMLQAAHEYSLGYSIYQKAFNWYVEWKGQTIPFVENTLILS
jgi:hypothetical protein